MNIQATEKDGEIGMTEQEKWENVIKALELCTSKIETRTQIPCETCLYHNRKYHGVHGKGCCNMRSLQRDMLALLKAQEPRVFNVGDFYGKEFGYLEYRTVRPGFSDFDLSSVLIVGIDEENVTVVFRSASVQKLPLDRMNKNWRIWSDYPTHKLLRAVEWNG